jgi:hypothetical protein
MANALTPVVAPGPVLTATGGTIPTTGPSLGERSRRMKRRHRLRRLVRAVIAASVVWIGALVAGFVMNGLGIGGLIVTFFVMAVVFALFLAFPRMRAPAAADIAGSDLKALAGRTELFLETQRPLLPPPAQGLLDRIGLELDQLSPQLATLSEREPAGDEARRLLGEHLPGLIESYTRIPAALRAQPNAGATPEQQLVSGLDVIAGEIGAMTGQIARGELDALATRGRYLETKYIGEAG